MSDYLIMLGFASCFGGLSAVESLWTITRVVYALSAITALLLAVFNHGHTL